MTAERDVDVDELLPGDQLDARRVRDRHPPPEPGLAEPCDTEAHEVGVRKERAEAVRARHVRHGRLRRHDGVGGGEELDAHPVDATAGRRYDPPGDRRRLDPDTDRLVLAEALLEQRLLLRGEVGDGGERQEDDDREERRDDHETRQGHRASAQARCLDERGRGERLGAPTLEPELQHPDERHPEPWTRTTGGRAHDAPLPWEQPRARRVEGDLDLPLRVRGDELDVERRVPGVDRGDDERPLGADRHRCGFDPEAERVTRLDDDVHVDDDDRAVDLTGLADLDRDPSPTRRVLVGEVEGDRGRATLPGEELEVDGLRARPTCVEPEDPDPVGTDHLGDVGDLDVDLDGLPRSDPDLARGDVGTDATVARTHRPRPVDAHGAKSRFTVRARSAPGPSTTMVTSPMTVVRSPAGAEERVAMIE